MREFDQLNLCYAQLDGKERLIRKQLSMFEAELALTVSKLEPPKVKQKRPKVPKLDLNKLIQPLLRRSLPPVKNVPDAPRTRLHDLIQIYERVTPKELNTYRKLKRINQPHHSISTPMLQFSITQSTDVDNFLPLLGNSKPLSTRP